MPITEPETELTITEPEAELTITGPIDMVTGLYHILDQHHRHLVDTDASHNEKAMALYCKLRVYTTLFHQGAVPEPGEPEFEPDPDNAPQTCPNRPCLSTFCDDPECEAEQQKMEIYFRTLGS